MHRILPVCIWDGLNLSTNLGVPGSEFLPQFAIYLLGDIRGFVESRLFICTMGVLISCLLHPGDDAVKQAL